jgi:hypothetical protein
LFWLPPSIQLPALVEQATVDAVPLPVRFSQPPEMLLNWLVARLYWPPAMLELSPSAWLASPPEIEGK